MMTLLLLSGCTLFDPVSEAMSRERGPLSDVRAVGSFSLVPCTESAAASSVEITERGGRRWIRSNGLPGHSIGAFPNPGNPHTVAAQSHVFSVPLEPGGAGGPAQPRFGVASNGIPFDAGTAEFWRNDRSSGWQYEALSGAIDLGVDCNRAHVQPGGVYHYHGIPEGLVDPEASMQLIGYAADGYPVYIRRGLRPSWRLRAGQRPGGDEPGGTYDGTFVQDYVFVEGSGDLDACNGRVGATPEHGESYHYVLTDAFPFVPRCTIAAADPSFQGHGPPGGRGRPPPPRR